MMACDNNCVELTKWIASIAVPAVAGFIGIITGAWLTSRRERKQRQLDFIRTQLREFYSPILGLRQDILMRSELRVKVQQAANTAWGKLSESVTTAEKGRSLIASRKDDFTKL